MKISEETITPDAAALLLKRTAETPQRGISEPLVNRITEAIRSGHWELTHQPIAVTAEGVVLDGRHRLSAIVAADQAVQVMVARDADPATFKAIDTGRNRNPGDLLRIAGFTNTNALAAAARYVMGAQRARRGDVQRSWSRIMQGIRHDEIVEFVQANARDLESGLSAGGRVATGVGRYGMRTWMAAAIYLVRESDVPNDIQAEFFVRLTDGAMLTPGSPILSLRRALLRSTTTGYNQMKGPVGLGATLKMFNAYVHGEKVQVTMFKPGVERFPGVDPWQPELMVEEQ